EEQRNRREEQRPGSSGSSDCSSGRSDGERERIRGRMRTVIGQLEGILQELKEVAKELREVVSQIDRLTSDFALDLDPDIWTPATASSTSSSDKGPLDFAASDILSDSWEFCSFLDASTPSDPGDCPDPARNAVAPFRLMNGGVPNGGTPDSSSEECFGSTALPKLPAARPAGTRERVRFSDKVLYHALCCDDDGDNDPAADAPEDPAGKGQREPIPRNAGTIPMRRAMRNSSTQTVADKSTQTLLPYVPARRRIPNKN
ncbi:CO059 protein, partial [Grantiella picta]|nr:CO059 protein [Grantiella picta]